MALPIPRRLFAAVRTQLCMKVSLTAPPPTPRDDRTRVGGDQLPQTASALVRIPP